MRISLKTFSEYTSAVDRRIGRVSCRHRSDRELTARNRASDVGVQVERSAKAIAELERSGAMT
jgi:hypothetical protein